MVIFDTSVIIDHLRRPQKPTLLDRLGEEFEGEIFAISTVTVQELYEGKSTKTEKKEVDILNIINKLRILPYTYEVAKLAGEIARDVGRPMDLADAAIAATAILNHAELATLDKKDFSGISDLQLIQKFKCVEDLI